MCTTNSRYLGLCIAVAAVCSVGQANAQLLLVDDFNGTSLDPRWTVHRGFASVKDGFLELSGSSPGTRDGYVYTAEAEPSWTDYHVTTRFITDGPAGLHNANVTFRAKAVGDYSGAANYTNGEYYGVGIRTPLWSPGGAQWLLVRVDDESGTQVTRTLAQGPIDTLIVPIRDRDNTMDIFAVGNQFRVSINGVSLHSGPIVDPYPDPHLFGGVGLQTVFESKTRFDYVTVGTVGPVPEPASYALWALGLTGVGLVMRRRRGN